LSRKPYNTCSKMQWRWGNGYLSAVELVRKAYTGIKSLKDAHISNVDMDRADGRANPQEPMGFFERLKAAASAEWRVYTEHPFTNGMADGLLVEAAFRHYLVQDYLFLIEFARAYALAVYKAPKLADMREAAAGLSAILDVEMNLHVKLTSSSLRPELGFRYPHGGET